MNLDLAQIVARLGDRPATALAPALTDPDLAKEASVLSHALQTLGPAIDEMPGRLLREADDVRAILRRFDAQSGAPARHAALIAAPRDMSRLSGMLEQLDALNAALCRVEDRLEAMSAAWAVALRRDILATYLRWTGAEPGLQTAESPR